MKLDNKYFSVEEMNSLIENLETAFSDYSDKADVFISNCKRFQNNDTFTGEKATVIKGLVGNDEVGIVNAQKDMQSKTLAMYKHAVESFADKVDSALNARLDLDTLDMVESDLKAIYSDVDTTCAEIENIAKEMQAKYGHLGHITVPDANPLRESLEELCGGYNPETGFYHDLKQKLINWDEEECAYIENQMLEEEIDSIQNNIVRLDNLIEPLVNNGKVVSNKTFDNRQNSMNSITYNYLIENGFEPEDISYISKNYPGGLSSVYGAIYGNSMDSKDIIRNLRIYCLIYNNVELSNTLKNRFYFSDEEIGYCLYDLYINDEIELLRTSFINDEEDVYFALLDSTIFRDDGNHSYISKYVITLPESIHGRFSDGREVELSPVSRWGIIGAGTYKIPNNKDSKGRYKVAVGPSLVNPNYPDDGKIWEDDFESDVYLQVFLKHKETGEIKTIQCFVDDYKANSFNRCSECVIDYKSGYIQTGIAYPLSGHSDDFERMDGSVIEFCSCSLDFNPYDYNLEGIVKIEN